MCAAIVRSIEYVDSFTDCVAIGQPRAAVVVFLVSLNEVGRTKWRTQWLTGEKSGEELGEGVIGKIRCGMWVNFSGDGLKILANRSHSSLIHDR